MVWITSFFLCVALAAVCSGFLFRSNIGADISSNSAVNPSRLALWAKRKRHLPSVGNEPRKFKRILQSAIHHNSSSRINELLTPAWESYLKYNATGNIYLNMMKVLNSTARRLNFPVNPEFGLKDKVVYPNMGQALSELPGCQVFYSAMKQHNLIEEIEQFNQTLFAPSDTALATLPLANATLSEASTARAFLRSVTVAGQIKTKRIIKLKDVTPPFLTLDGTTVVAKNSKTGEVTMNGCKVSNSTSVKCNSGYIHLLDTVVLPK